MSVKESSNSLSLTPVSNCTDLVPYVAPEKALGLQKLAVPVANYALTFLGTEDLPALACTSRGNQELAVSQCFQRMGSCTKLSDFTGLTRTLRDCAGKRNPLGPQDLIERIPGTWKLEEISLCHPDYPGDTSTNYSLLGSNANNARLAAKLPNVVNLTFAGDCPDLSPFAKSCTRLRELTFRNSDLFVDEPLQGQFSATLSQVTLLNCDQVSSEGYRQLRELGPGVETITIRSKRPGKKGVETTESIKPASSG